LNPDAFIARFRERWQALNQTQKVISVLVAAGILVCLFYLGQVLVRPAYTTLFTGLEPKDAGGIVEKLKAMNVSYEVADGGKTIKVPESRVHEVRIQLASEGVLGSGGAGFELFDQNKFGKTEFDQQVDYQRALQEELRRTIVRLEGVEQARVHLVLPQKSVFISEQETSSASVALKLKPLYHLEPGQVRGICDLLVGSVEGLKPENIHIIDTEGNVLSDDLNIGGGADAVLAATALEHQETRREYEKELENRIKQMLTRIIGQNQAVVMVTAVLDFDRREVTSSTSSNPDNVKISEHTVTENSEGTEYGGAAGTESNLTGYPSAEGNGASSYTREESTVNYQVDTRQETVVVAPGTVEKLSAAVVVNNANGPVDVQKVRDVVAAAIGYDQDRGDNIEVTEMAFDDSYQKQVAEQFAQADVQAGERERLYTYAAASAGALAVLLLLAFLLKRRFSARRVSAAEEEEKEFMPVKAAEVDQEQKVRDETQLQIRDMAKNKPQEVAEILKVWLKE